MNKDAVEINQAQHDPIESLEKLDEFIDALGELPKWNEGGVLTDELAHNQLLVLLSDNYYVSMRLNLVFEDIGLALDRLGIAEEVHVRHMQGRRLKKDNLVSMESIVAIWNECQAQSMDIEIKELPNFLRAIWEKRQLKGRGKPFSKGTLEQLARASHGYCMFEGCGENLHVDKLSGYAGNFAYNAHIVASSESGPRGVPYLSDYQSDNPENVLVLCDKHHRLIDKVAAVDFDAGRLSQMRSNFTYTVESLLEGLSFRPIPAFSVLWPVGGHIVSEPDERDIANSLSRIRARSQGRLNRLSHNERRYRRRVEAFESNIADIVKEEAEDIIQQTQSESHKAALFAFGPMPALVGLGACLGNKCEITPMLRFRDGGYWMWPQEMSVQKPYTIKLDEAGLDGVDEVTVCVAMTNYPDTMKNTADAIGVPIIEIIAIDFGNAAIPHPENGKELRADLHSLLLKLCDKFSIRRVNLLVCASNAVCVFAGQAFDLYQPALTVYDFSGDCMKPMLEITYEKNRVQIVTLR